MSTRTAARHRNPDTTLTVAAKTSAAVVASGSLAATVAVQSALASSERPASANPAPQTRAITTAASSAPAVAGFGEMQFAPVKAAPKPAVKKAVAEKIAEKPAAKKAVAKKAVAKHAERISDARTLRRSFAESSVSRSHVRHKRTPSVTRSATRLHPRSAITVSRSTARHSLRSTSKIATTHRNRSVRTYQESSAPRTGGVIGLAQRFTGIWYSWGGTTPSGFDCSGYTQYIFNSLGVSLPRTAEAQRQASTTVAEPRPGDLVFFGAPAFHVGIYAGNGMMYDAPRTGKQTGLHRIWSSNVSYGRP